MRTLLLVVIATVGLTSVARADTGENRDNQPREKQSDRSTKEGGSQGPPPKDTHRDERDPGTKEPPKTP
jgi:hypothetical protein